METFPSGGDRPPPPPTGHVTLGQLQRIYTQSYARLSGPLLDTLSESEAHQVVQEAFATAARTRFTFHTERALATWIAQAIAGASEASESAASSTPSLTPCICDWDDVLNRASISIHASYDPSPVAATPSVGRGQVRAALRGLLVRNAKPSKAPHESPGPEPRG